MCECWLLKQGGLLSVAPEVTIVLFIAPLWPCLKTNKQKATGQNEKGKEGY